MENIRSYKDLRVYKSAMDAAMRIYEFTKHFPADERHSLTDQFAERRAQCVPTLAKVGENAAIRPTL